MYIYVRCIIWLSIEENSNDISSVNSLKRKASLSRGAAFSSQAIGLLAKVKFVAVKATQHVTSSAWISQQTLPSHTITAKTFFDPLPSAPVIKCVLRIVSDTSGW